MFPIPSVLWMKIGAAVAFCAAIYFMGWNHEHKKLVEYKAEVAALGKAQEEKNVALVAEHKQIAEGIKNEYEAKLAAVNNYYTRGLYDAHTGNLPSSANAPSGATSNAAYAELARQCAATTLELAELQKWVKSVTHAK
jgi:hypothetical protein